jgi:hypothetical protein
MPNGEKFVKISRAAARPPPVKSLKEGLFVYFCVDG